MQSDWSIVMQYLLYRVGGEPIIMRFRFTIATHPICTSSSQAMQGIFHSLAVCVCRTVQPDLLVVSNGSSFRMTNMAVSSIQDIIPKNL